MANWGWWGMLIERYFDRGGFTRKKLKVYRVPGLYST